VLRVRSFVRSCAARRPVDYGDDVAADEDDADDVAIEINTHNFCLVFHLWSPAWFLSRAREKTRVL
jgi:hypothetical protein